METGINGSNKGAEPKGLRTGYTTGSCAAAGAKAACMALFENGPIPDMVAIKTPSGRVLEIPVKVIEIGTELARFSVRKYSGDDPDVTDGALIVVEVRPCARNSVTLEAGEGVGTVTRPGLAVPRGEPAINPVPRAMIIDAVREVTTNGVTVRISIPEGEILAQKTFNPRLGIKGGLSILGTSGIVRPFSSSAIRDSIACAINVAVACKVRHPVMVPGGIGLKAAFSIFALNEEQVVEVSNEWGHCLDRAAGKEFSAALVLGHPGKLAKLAGGSWDTHSSRSGSAAPYVETVARSELGYDPKGCGTVEAIFQGLALSDRKRLANALSMRISSAINSRINGKFPCSVFLIDLAGNRLGHYGDLTPWPTKGE